jgi:hypothetical protein
MADSFELTLVANNEEGLNLILEHTPINFFLEIDPSDKSKLSLMLINELHRYLKDT